MRLQIRGLIGDQGVGRGVGLVEAVTAEEFDQPEDFRRGPSRGRVRGPLDECSAAAR